MKILFFVSSLHAGGAERVASTLVSAWVREGHAVTLVPTFTGRGTRFYPVDKAVRLIWLADRMGFHLGRAHAAMRKLAAIRRLVREERPDVILSFLTNVNVMVLLATRGLGVPVVVGERTNPAVSTSAGGMLQRLRRLTYPWADIVTLQTEASVAPFREMVSGMKQVAVVPNPMPPELLEIPLHRGAPQPGLRRKLVAMGRMVPAKRFAELIEAFGALAESHPEWDLVIWGDGPLRETLAGLARERGLEARVSLPGRTNQPWQEVAGADLFAMTSEVEGFPNVLLEAMALGVPCVAVDCPSGPREITQDGEDALLVPLGDRAALVQALATLMDDPVLRQALGRRGAESVRARYALPEVLAQWHAVLEAAIETKGQNTKDPQA